ncbi:hypothetical protein HTT03_00905 [Sulfitobacter sp. S0837]|uniref:hypothetical protein n=1 Tax=Sulfitobacter maritimus TaxID=2741719 RepID=UPI001581B70D|nr:hypothetical protein [Sulfitobacter maritimus]NUH63866.1 hypothetical protein [Sulfitobacter maritimus]
MTDLSLRSEIEEEAPSDILSSVAVLAPRGRDDAVARQVLAKDQIATATAPSLSALPELIARQIGAVLITEEALNGAEAEELKEALDAQPS